MAGKRKRSRDIGYLMGEKHKVVLQHIGIIILEINYTLPKTVRSIKSKRAATPCIPDCCPDPNPTSLLFLCLSLPK